jgi:hypothetical protein
MRLNDYSTAFILALVLAIPAFSHAKEPMAQTTSIELGKAIYRYGQLPDGTQLTGRIVNDVEISGERAACANCHKRSGLGSNEGETFAPPISGDILFSEFRLKAHRLSTDPTTGTSDLDRPAYTQKALFDTLTTGISNTGKALEAIMPRYTISDEHYQYLYSYLQTLAADDDPGVTDDTLHIATIVDQAAPAEAAAFMTEILELYVDKLNAGSRHETRRAKYAPIQKEWKYESYRKYKLHVWPLSRDQHNWKAQLEDHYRETPVFAIVSGISERSWAPVHDFCNANEIPCIFPSTPLPKVATDNFYTLYFSRGLTSETRILASYINDNQDSLPTDRIIQLYDASSYGSTAYKLLQQYLTESLQQHIVNIDLDTAKPEQLAQVLAEPGLVIYWSRYGADILNNSLRQIAPDSTVFVPYWLARSEIFTRRANNYDFALYTSYPYIDPAKETRHLIRPLSWLRVNKVENRDNIVLADTFTAMLLFSDAIKHIRSNFNRAYVLELLEHMVDNAVVTSLYPRLSLGPDQRYASKGGTIMKLTGDPAAPVEAATDWIVPSD